MQVPYVYTDYINKTFRLLSAYRNFRALHFKEFKKISNGADSIISTFRNKSRYFVNKEVRKFIYTWRSSILKAFSFPLKKTVLFLNEEKS